MPLFALCKQRFDPDSPFAIRLFVGFCGLISSDPIQILLMHTAAKSPPLLAGSALGFEWTMIAVLGICPVASRAFGGLALTKMQLFACRTNVHIPLGIVLEQQRAKEFRAMVVIGQRDEGMDVLMFDGDNVLFRA